MCKDENYNTPWSPPNTVELHYQYINGANVFTLSEFFDRYIGEIITQLRRLKLIIKRSDARGYDEYRNSQEYMNAIVRWRTRQDVCVGKRIIQNNQKMAQAALYY